MEDRLAAGNGQSVIKERKNWYGNSWGKHHRGGKETEANSWNQRRAKRRPSGDYSRKQRIWREILARCASQNEGVNIGRER